MTEPIWYATPREPTPAEQQTWGMPYEEALVACFEIDRELGRSCTQYPLA